MKSVILVSGKGGQLAAELQQIASLLPSYDFLFTTRKELDITAPAQLQNYFEQYRPKFFINCAAYTAVDKAEEDKETAYKVNASAVQYIANCCTQYNTTFIHFSTDYVFDGTKCTPYLPDDECNPINYYGYTKREGEVLALKHCPQSLIIRTSWVYSSFGHNFVKTMCRLMKERTSIQVVNDQIGSPTYAANLAEVVMQIIPQLENNASAFSGIYHYTNDGIISWFDFASAIRCFIKASCEVNPIPTIQYPTPAKRPAYSVLNKDKILHTFHLSLQPWKNSLEQCLKKLNAIP